MAISQYLLLSIAVSTSIKLQEYIITHKFQVGLKPWHSMPHPQASRGREVCKTLEQRQERPS